MSSDQKSASGQNAEHGSMKSYVIGFLLSLIFTFIPYYLVVNQTITGTSLLITILGFAVIQMIIQVTFFLHLGRGPKPNWNLFFFASTVGIIMVVVGGSVLIINNLHYNMSPSDQTKKLLNDEGIHQIGGEKTGVCQGQYSNHTVTVKDSQVNPALTLASKCDTLTFINQDDSEIVVTFGAHDGHGAYAGETGVVVRRGRSKTITLSEPGTFEFHNHFNPATAGAFTVTDL